MGTKRNSDSHPIWKQRSKKIRETLRAEDGAVVWRGRPDVRLRGLETASGRVRDALGVTWALQCRGYSKPFNTKDPHLRKDLWCDVSQGRRGSGSPTTLTTRSMWYSFEWDRVLVPSEILGVLGHGAPNIRSLLRSSVRELAGEGMVLPCLGVLLHSSLLAATLPGMWQYGAAPVTVEPGPYASSHE